VGASTTTKEEKWKNATHALSFLLYGCQKFESKRKIDSNVFVWLIYRAHSFNRGMFREEETSYLKPSELTKMRMRQKKGDTQDICSAVATKKQRDNASR